MFLIQCEELRMKHPTPLHVVTMPYACLFLWQVDYIEDFKWCRHFQSGVAFWRVVLKEVYFEGPNRVRRTLTTSSIYNITRGCPWPVGWEWSLAWWVRWVQWVVLGGVVCCYFLRDGVSRTPPPLGEGAFSWLLMHLSLALLGFCLKKKKYKI